VLSLLLRIIEGLVGEEDPARHIAGAKKILIVDPAAIGDMVMSTPAYRAVKEYAGGPEIHAMIFEEGRPVFRHNPYCDQVRVIPRTSLAGQLKAALGMRRERYDVIINLYTGLRMNFFCFLIGAPLRVGYNYRHRGCFHNVRVPIATRTVRTIYRPEECLRLLEQAFGWKVRNRAMIFEVSEAERSAVETFLSTKGAEPGDLLVGVHANSGSRQGEKRWTEANFAALADHLMETYGVRVVFTGSGADAEYVGSVMAKVKNKNRVISCVGALTLGELGALLGRLALFVSLDTGPLHISIAMGTPTFGLLAVVPQELVIPAGNPRCRAISAGPHSTEGLASLRDLPVAAVAERIARMNDDLHIFTGTGGPHGGPGGTA